MRDIAIEWLHRAQSLSPGQEIYLPCQSKDDQKKLWKMFGKEHKILAEIDPVMASNIFPYLTFKDKKFWLVLKRVVG